MAAKQINWHVFKNSQPFNQLIQLNTFASGSAPAWDRLIDLTLEVHGPTVNVLI